MVLSSTDLMELGCAALCAVVAARGWIVHSIVRAALRKAEPSIQAFKRSFEFVGPLPDEWRTLASDLLSLIRHCQELRATVLARVKDIKVPHPELPTSYKELMSDIETTGTSYRDTVKMILKVKISLKVLMLVKDEAKHRFYDWHDIAGDALPHPSALDQVAISILDKLHVIDGAALGMETIFQVTDRISGHVHHHAHVGKHGVFDFASDSSSDGMADGAADAMADSVGDFADGLMEFWTIPAIVPGIKSALREIKMVMNDETSISEAFRHGAIPSATRSLWVAAGALADGVLFGGFPILSIGGALLAKSRNDARLRKEIAGLVNLLREHVKAIRAWERRALSAITAAVEKLLRAFATLLGACPDICDQRALKTLMDELREAYKCGLRCANVEAVEKARQLIEGLSPRKRWEKLLGIDSRTEVEQRYWEVVREIESINTGVANGFLYASERGLDEAIVFIMKSFIFNNRETGEALRRAWLALPAIAEGYIEELSQWEHKCSAAWESGTREVEQTAAREHAELNAYIAENEAAMAALRRKIKAHQRRLGVKLAT